MGTVGSCGPGGQPTTHPGKQPRRGRPPKNDSSEVPLSSGPTGGLQHERLRPTPPQPAQTRGPELVNGKGRQEEMRALRARMAKANEALCSGWPWERAEKERDPQGRPPPIPGTSANTTRFSRVCSSAPSMFKPTLNWAEWPTEHCLKHMRVTAGRRSQTEDPPRHFHPVSTGYRTLSWKGCWNCGQDHRLRDCPEPIRNRRFCFGCGRVDTTKKRRPDCSEDWKDGIKYHWKESLGIEG